MTKRGWRARRAGLALVLASLAPAAAAEVYKIVGPDGQVTYSDRPPVAAPGASATVVGPRPKEAPVPNPEGPRLQNPPSTPPRARAAAPASSATEARPRPPLPAPLVQALQDVLAREGLVQAMFDTCTRTQPELYDRLSDHVRIWRHHNLQLVTQADRVAGIGLTPAGRKEVQAVAQARVDAQMQPLLRGPRGPLAQWCEVGVHQLVDGTLDLEGDSAVTEPIAAWTAP